VSDQNDSDLEALRRAYRSAHAPPALLDEIRGRRHALATRRRAFGWPEGALAAAAAVLLVAGVFALWPQRAASPPTTLTDIGIALETPELPDMPADHALRIAATGANAVAGWSLRPPRRPDLPPTREENSI